MTKMLTVYRVEHDDCGGHSYNAPREITPFYKHGTMTTPDSYRDYCGKNPPFGGIGNCPDRILSHQICGVTAEQYDRWWRISGVNDNYQPERPGGRYVDGEWIEDSSHLYMPVLAEEFIELCSDYWNRLGWFAIKYEIPESLVRYDQDQVIFDPRDAVRVGRVSFLEPYKQA